MSVTDTPSLTPAALDERIKATVRRIAKDESQLDRLIAGQADAVLDPVKRRAILLRNAQAALIKSQDRYHRLVTRMSAVVFELARDGTVLFVNDAISDVTGYTPQELEGRNWWEVLCPDELHGQAEQFNARLRAGDVNNDEITLRTKSRSKVVLEISSANRYDAQGTLQIVVALGIDITERKQAEAGIRQAAAVFESTSEVIVVTDPAFRILVVNQALAVMTGYEPKQVVGKDIRQLISEQDHHSVFTGIAAALSEAGHWQGEIGNRRENGEHYPAWGTASAVRDESGQLTNFVFVFSDITALKEAEERLRYLVNHDALTGVANRTLFNARLEQSLERARRHHSAVAVFFLDLDRFKRINDTLGHEYGDELLKIVADRLAKAVRVDDTVARLGGDEFTLVLDDIHRPEDAARLAEVLIKTVSSHADIRGRRIATSASIGISMFPDDGKTAGDLVKAADAAMYLAKRRGGMNFQFYAAEQTKRASNYFSIEAGLRQALERDELFLQYQPQIEVTTGRVVAVEALLRWRHSERGVLLPEEFISVAEETGLIEPIGEWVLHSAYTQGQAWLESGIPPVRIVINLSGSQLVREERFKRFKTVLAETLHENGEAMALEIEITESALQVSEVLDRFSNLKSQGVRLGLDNFGVGYSSLAWLKIVPVDTLKISRSFIHDLPGDATAVAIASAIVVLGRKMGLEVIAEGVETLEQVACLTEMGCTQMMGFFFCKPCSADHVARFMAEEKSLETVG